MIEACVTSDTMKVPLNFSVPFSAFGENKMFFLACTAKWLNSKRSAWSQIGLDKVDTRRYSWFWWFIENIIIFLASSIFYELYSHFHVKLSLSYPTCSSTYMLRVDSRGPQSLDCCKVLVSSCSVDSVLLSLCTVEMSPTCRDGSIRKKNSTH